MRLLGAVFAVLTVSGTASAQAPCAGGVATLNGVSYPCSGIDLWAVVSPQAMGALPAGQCASSFPGICNNDVWGWTDPETGREYALVGATNGTAFVDVTEPTPRLLGRLPTANTNTTWRDVKTYGHWAFVVADSQNHGMQVFDLTRLRGLAEDASRTFTADARYTGVTSAHNIVVNEATGFAYAVGFRVPLGAGLPAECNIRGLHAIDVRNPLAPVFAGCFSDAAQDQNPVVSAGYTHDAQCVTYRGPDAEFTGREICVAFNEDVVAFFDATDKANVQLISQVGYPNDAYTHQGWFTDDHRYVLANDELDERASGNGVDTQRTLIFDAEGLRQPDFIGIWDSGITSVDHNLYVRGRYAYLANYEAGLRVLDLTDIASASLTEIAFFDTHPQSTTTNFNGAWSSYPYFESGTVLVNDTRNGLFVLRPVSFSVAGEPAPSDAATGGSLASAQPNPAGTVARFILRIDAPQPVRAELFDATGRRVAEVFRGPVSGMTELRADVSGLPAGMYVLRVSGPSLRLAQTVTVSR